MAEQADEALARRLVETYSDQLLRLGYSLLNSVPDAQDVCQEVLLKRLDYAGTFESQAHERAWLVRVTINACKNLRRSLWRRRTAALDDVPELFSRRRAGSWRRSSASPFRTGRCWYSTIIWVTTPTRSANCWSFAPTR